MTTTTVKRAAAHKAHLANQGPTWDPGCAFCVAYRLAAGDGSEAHED